MKTPPVCQTCFDRAAYRSSPANIAILDQEGTIISVNENWQCVAHQQGMSPASQCDIGVNYIKFCRTLALQIPEIASLADKLLQMLKGDAHEFSFEYPCHSPEEERWFLLYATPLPEPHAGILLTHFNATPLILAEKFVEHVPDVYWLCTADFSKVLYVSKYYEAIWGRSVQSIYANPNDWIEAIHPEDREQVQKDFFGLALAGGFNRQYRIIRPDGEVRWIRDRGYPLKNKNGSVSKIYGVAQDITAFKKQEIEKEQQYKGVISNKDIALKEMLGHLHSEKSSLADSIVSNLRTFVLPLIDQMRIAKSFQPALLERLEKNIHDLLSPFGKKLRESHGLLSGKELEIANMIRQGHSTKDIAKLLNISTHTVVTHRYRIRKKLKIKNKKTNLASYLDQILQDRT